MLAPETIAEIPTWKTRKDAQWERVKDAMPGLQLAVSGEQSTKFMLTCSAHDGSFYESIVFGQLPQVQYKVEGSPRRPSRRLLADHDKPLDKRRIDLSDAEIDQVIARWQEERTALDLPFVTAVWGADGRMRVR